MDDTWNRTEFKDELEALLNIQLPVSQSKIESLRNLAIKHPKHQNYLVQCICKFIETAPPDYRVPGLYLIDAIVRRCKDDKEEDRIASEYRKRFFVVFKDGALTGLFHPCIEKDKTRVDKVLNFWSEHVFPKQFVEQLKITVIQDIERRRQPVVLPTNYATDIALQQQGWQPGNTPPPPPTTTTTTHSASPPADTHNESNNVPPRLPQQGIQPQLPINPLDFSNAVMHFLSVLNYSGSLPMGMPQPPMYGFPPAQQPYPYLSHMTTETTRSPTESKEVQIKTEDIPSCAEQTASEKLACPSPIVKNEVMDTPFDRPPIKDSQSGIESSQTSDLPPPPHTAPLPPAPIPTQAPPTAPPLPPTLPNVSAQAPTVPAPRSVQPPKTPPLPSATLQGSTTSAPVVDSTFQRRVSQQDKPVPPPKTPPLKSIPPPKTPPLPPQVPQKRLREPSPVSLPKKVAKDTTAPSSSQQPMPMDINVSSTNVHIPKATLKANMSKVKGVDKGSTLVTDVHEEKGKVDTAVTSKSVMQEKKSSEDGIVSAPAAPLAKFSVDSKVTSRSATLTKPSRWDIKAKNIKPVDTKETTKSTADIKTSGSSTKASTDVKTSSPSTKASTDVKTSSSSTKASTDVKTSGSSTKASIAANQEVNSSVKVGREDKDNDNSARTSIEVTTKREQKDAGSSAKTSTETITKPDGDALPRVSNGGTGKRDEISASAKTPTEATTKETNVSSVPKDMDIDKPSNAKEVVKGKRIASDNAREPSPKRSKTATERPSRSEPSSTSKIADAPTKSRVEKSITEAKVEKSSNATSISSPKTKKTSPQPTKDRSSSSRTVDHGDRHSTRDYTRDRDDRHPRDCDREKDDHRHSRDYDREKDDHRYSRDYDREKDGHRYYSPHQQHDQPPRHSTPYSPTQPSNQPIDPVYSYSRFARPGPISDPTLRLGTIRVLSRTLYVGPMSTAIKEDEVTEVFSQFGEVMSVIFSYRSEKLKNAFVKFINRESLQAAKDGSDGITFRSRPVKVNWAHGFGPKQCFNYDKGESILILNRLSDEDCASLKAAPVGGFQGSRLRDQVTVEEPGPLQQSTHREETGSPNFYEVRKFEDSDRMPQSEYQQYYGNDYPPISNPGYTQAPVEANGFYDQQGNYVYLIAEQQPSYYGPPLYPTSGAAGQPQYYQAAVTMQYQQSSTPPTSQHFARPQYYQYTYNNPNYAPTNQAYYFQQQYQSSGTEYPSDYRRQ